MKSPHVVESSDRETEETGLPFFHSWKGVYLFVIGTFIFWVVLLVALTKMFS
jgi:hypothetical protein